MEELPVIYDEYEEPSSSSNRPKLSVIYEETESDTSRKYIMSYQNKKSALTPCTFLDFKNFKKAVYKIIKLLDKQNELSNEEIMPIIMFVSNCKSNQELHNNFYVNKILYYILAKIASYENYNLLSRIIQFIPTVIIKNTLDGFKILDFFDYANYFEIIYNKEIRELIESKRFKDLDEIANENKKKSEELKNKNNDTKPILSEQCIRLNIILSKLKNKKLPLIKKLLSREAPIISKSDSNILVSKNKICPLQTQPTNPQKKINRNMLSIANLKPKNPISIAKSKVSQSRVITKKFQ